MMSSMVNIVTEGVLLVFCLVTHVTAPIGSGVPCFVLLPIPFHHPPCDHSAAGCCAREGGMTSQ